MDSLSAGRVPAKLAESAIASDCLFASERLDGSEIASRQISHSTFVNVSFLATKIQHSRFVNCIFIGCYFRKTEISASAFVGCRFIDCIFDFSTIQNTDFKYSKFRRSVLPYRDMQFSAPSEPNLRRDLFYELSRAADSVGDADEARSYRLAAIDATNVHLWAGVKAQSTWYAEHFPTERRLAAGFTLLWHYLNRALWQHGESAWRLLRSALIAVLGLFPLLLFLGRESAGSGTDYADSTWLSVSNFLLLDRLSDLTAASTYLRIVSATEALSGIVFAGLFVTLVVKALLRR